MMRRLLLVILLALTPPLAMAQDAPDNPADTISDEIFGPRVPTDEAFGAFQRGYFLTALELALPRANFPRVLLKGGIPKFPQGVFPALR